MRTRAIKYLGLIKTNVDNGLLSIMYNTALSVIKDSTKEQNTTVPFLSIVAVTVSDRVAVPSCEVLL